MFQALKIGDGIYEIDWHKQPIKLQKRIPFLLSINRKPKYFSGYKLVTASRDSFKEVEYILKLTNSNTKFWFLFVLVDENCWLYDSIVPCHSQTIKKTTKKICCPLIQQFEHKNGKKNIQFNCIFTYRMGWLNYFSKPNSLQLTINCHLSKITLGVTIYSPTKFGKNISFRAFYIVL